MIDLNNISQVYFIGIGGIGMSALARYFNSSGIPAQGYDKTGSILTDRLVSEGIPVQYEDDFAAIPDSFKSIDSSLVVITPAVPQSLEILVRFRESGIPIIKRAQLLGQLSKGMTCLAVAGTHGKTTTSSILAHLMLKSGVELTAFLGGVMQEYQTNFLHTGNEVMVVEADEFDRSFMSLHPDITGITAMDPDHLDIYGDITEFEKTFHEFAALTDRDKLIVRHGLPISAKTAGVEIGDHAAQNVVVVDGTYHFDLKTPEQVYQGFCLKLPGRHNLFNAVLALSMALEHGVEVDLLKIALLSFKGVERRFSYLLDTPEIVLIDDYAHHPTEINAVYDAVTEMYPDEKITAIFQPHLYSRTRDFADEFAAALSKFDVLAICDIYPARELPIPGIDARMLVNKICAMDHKPVRTVLIEKNDLTDFIREIDHRVTVVMGAGDIGVEAQKIKLALE